MKRTIRFSLQSGWLAGLACSLAVALAQAAPEAASKSGADRERELLAVIRSDAPVAEKAITCKFLAIYGSAAAVPVVAPLLADPELSSWARIALEAIPGSASDDALRQALGQLEGRLLVGVIRSIGVRRDAKAVEHLIEKLGSPDEVVAAAAAEVLGRLGGDRATEALMRVLADTSRTAGLRSASAEGLVGCAESFLAQGQAARAARLYDAVRGAPVAKQRVLEGIRGAILARGTAGIPLLLEQLRAADRDRVGIGLRTARELPGPEVTQALASELKSASPERQAPLLLALSDRRDDSVLPAVLGFAESAETSLRVVAIGALDRMGNVSCLPVLLEAAADDNAAVSRAAKLAVGRLEDDAVDPELLGRLPGSSGRMRQVLVELAGVRRLQQAVPLVLTLAQDSDPGIRRAACETLGLLGEESDAAELVRLLERSSTSRERRDLERALASICGRVGASTVKSLLPLVKHPEGDVRATGLRVLATVGGPEALAVVVRSLEDADEAVRDEAVRTLAGWPANWPDDSGAGEPLLALARSEGKPSYRIQGMRGYLQFVQDSRALEPGEKLARVEAILPEIERVEEKRQAIGVLGSVPTPEALEVLVHFTEDEAMREEACQAIVRVVTHDKMKAAPEAIRRSALERVVAQSKEEATRRRAQGILRRL
jgi:HEAT repeat protein